MQFSILYEDNDLLVIDKPFGIVVNRAESVKVPTVQDWVFSVIPGIARDPFRVNKVPDDYYSRSGIVHRLDKETSGCLIIAKTPDNFLKLQSFFKERKVKKTYLALVHGKLVPEEGEIRAPVGRLPWNRERFGVVPGGKEAVTRYKALHYYSSSEGAKRLSREVSTYSSRLATARSNNNNFSFVKLYPETGRTHQIRVHMKYINHPLVGDYLYAGRKTQRNDRTWCPRVFLHAAKIEFPQPTTGKIIQVTSEMPKELEGILASLSIRLTQTNQIQG